MIVNSKILHLPPYISTDWNHIASLHLEENVLVITLTNDHTISIPDLSLELLEKIFKLHANHLIQETQSKTELSNHPIFIQEKMPETPFKFGFSTLDDFGSVLQHNQAQANAPDLPMDVLKKISAITKIVAPEDPHLLPKAEPDCNCFHCQIARALQDALEDINHPKKVEDESIVSDEELKFQSWDVQQTSEKMYLVTNRLDLQEKYTVYLGDPIGCTCGQSKCEHILAVLKT